MMVSRTVTACLQLGAFRTNEAVSCTEAGLGLDKSHGTSTRLVPFPMPVAPVECIYIQLQPIGIPLVPPDLDFGYPILF